MNNQELLQIIRSKVDSSNILSIGHKDQYLTVEFKNHNIYCYYPVTKDGYDELMKAESKGKYLNANIKSNENVTCQKL